MQIHYHHVENDNLVISLPLTIIEPDSLSSRPPNNINKEDFPEPDGPTSATVSSSNSEKFTEFRICSLPDADGNDKLKSVVWMSNFFFILACLE